MRNKAAGENRTVVTSYITDTDNLLTANQINAVALISRKQLKDVAVNKRENEKLNRYINMVNDILYFFIDINSRNVSIRDKKLNILVKFKTLINKNKFSYTYFFIYFFFINKILIF